LKRTNFRIIGVILIAVLVLLGGCDKFSLQKGITIADTPFSAVLEIDTEQGDFIGNVKRLGLGTWEYEITEPQNLAGLKISVNNESVTTSMNGYSNLLPIETISDHALFLQVFRTMDNALSQEEPDIEEKDGVMTVRGSISTSPYEIIFSSETGLPQEIKLPDSQIQAYISEFTPIR
jgi:hypothetical protein